jgi:acetylornithine deacetylase/succinyl-diaminopimelate desuccinylase-like protein
MDGERTKKFIGEIWDDAVVPTLVEYIRIPNKSPAFDPDWATNGFMDEAVDLLESWAREKISTIPGAKLEIVRLEGRTPVILIEIPGFGEGASGARGQDRVLLYGHLDKQPEMKGWAEGLGPWTPVRKGEKLFGRGGADDGYAMFGALSAILALREQKIAHAPCTVLIESCEESGSFDLPYYVDHLSDRLGKPSLVVCLDSGCGDYERLWLTTSLRGTSIGVLNVGVLKEGVHSGDASGVVPSSFRIARMLLSRLEDEITGRIIPGAFHVAIPEERVHQACQAAEILGPGAFGRFGWVGKAHAVADDIPELILNRTWRPQLSVTGAEGLPLPKDAGAVTLPFVRLKLSLRLPPTLNAYKATMALTELLTSDPPYGADVSFAPEHGVDGWNAPTLSPWLEAAVAHAGKAVFGTEHAYMGEGGTIPFMAMLGAKFPETQFVITGVLGPGANAHGPNEFLHIPTGKRVSEAVAHVLAGHCARKD